MAIQRDLSTKCLIEAIKGKALLLEGFYFYDNDGVPFFHKKWLEIEWTQPDLMATVWMDSNPLLKEVFPGGLDKPIHALRFISKIYKHSKLNQMPFTILLVRNYQDGNYSNDPAMVKRGLENVEVEMALGEKSKQDVEGIYVGNLENTRFIPQPDLG